MQKHYSSIHLKNEEDVEMDEAEDNVFEDEIDVETPDNIDPIIDDVEDVEKDLESQASAITENEERLILENEEFIKDNILGGSAEYESKGRYLSLIHI